MHRWLCAAMTAFFLAAAGPAGAGDPLVLQLKWLPDAQFAGYFVAEAKGFYRKAGLDVTIKPGGPDINPSQVLASGGADVAVDWMASALAARDRGGAGRQYRADLPAFRAAIDLPSRQLG